MTVRDNSVATWPMLRNVSFQIIFVRNVERIGRSCLLPRLSRDLVAGGEWVLAHEFGEVEGKEKLERLAAIINRVLMDTIALARSVQLDTCSTGRNL